MLIRLANKNDIDDLIRLRLEYINHDIGQMTKEIEKEFEEQLKIYFKRAIDNNFVGVLCEIDKKIVSCAYLAIYERPSKIFPPSGKNATVLNVYTYDKYRGRGCCTKVLKVLIDEAKKRNLSYIDLSSSSMARSIYKKHGFEIKEQSKFVDMRLKLK